MIKLANFTIMNLNEFNKHLGKPDAYVFSMRQKLIRQRKRGMGYTLPGAYLVDKLGYEWVVIIKDAE
jgi:hypothetical protein